MITRFRRPMLVLGTTILIMQAIFTPVGMVYAETTVDTEEQAHVDLPPMKNYLEEEQVSDPRFFFTRSCIQGTAEEPLQVTFFSDQEVSKARVFLPEEATLLKKQLPTGISVELGAQSNEWIIQSKRAQHTFVLPLVIEKSGDYELTVEETTVNLEIREQEEINEEFLFEETKAAYEDQIEKDKEIEEAQGNEQSPEEVREPETEAPQEQQTDEESQVVDPTIFDGETAEVTTMAQFREAVVNTDIGIISVQANLTEATASILTVNRPLLIQGNGYTLTFAHNGLYFQLEEVPKPCVFRIENAILTKVGTMPLVNSTVVNSTNWTFELEDVNEFSANSMRLANLPNGSVLFTGGESNFTRPAADQTFIQAKEIIATNNTKVIIDRGAASIFFSDVSIATPKIEVKNGSSVYLSVSSHIPAIHLQGSDSHIHVNNGGNLSVTSSAGVSMNLTGQAPSISVTEKSEVTMTGLLTLTGSKPEVSIQDSKIRLDRLSLIGDQARLTLDASEVTISSGNNSTLLLLDGSNVLLSLDNQSRLEVTSTWATTFATDGSDTVRLGNGKEKPTLSVKNESKLAITAAGASSTNVDPSVNANNGLHIRGTSAHVEILQDSLVDVTITSGRRRRAILWSGANSTVEVSNSRLNVNDSLGWSEINFGTTGIPKISIAKSAVSMDGIVTLTGSEPEVNIKNSKIRLDRLSLIGDQARLTLDASEVTISSGNNRTLLLLDGSNVLLSLDNQSRLEVTSTWATTSATDGSDTVRLGNGKEKPTLSVKNESKLAITAAGASSTNVNPSVNANNGLHIGGRSAHVEILQDSLVDVTITSGRRRAILLRGESPALNIKGGSLVMKSQFQGMTLGANATINVLESGSFIAQALQSGVVNGGVMNIVFDDVLLIDIQHRNRGNIFDAAVGSTLVSKNNNLSLWQKSANLDNDPQRIWDSFDYALSGRDFNVITEANNPDFNVNIESFGQGLSLYSRMNSEGYGQRNDSLVPPVDPLLPENEIDPENPPILPEDQGLLSIDFVSQFQFGIPIISAQDHTYYAQSQRLLDADGTEQRPNYVQISDRRRESERKGWQLAVTQKEQFKGEENQELLGASLSLSNQQVITAQGGTTPRLQSDPCTLIPGKRRTLLIAQGNEGAGTWIYRFGDSDTKGESVALNVPKGANPEATNYSTALIWELSAVPGN